MEMLKKTKKQRCSGGVSPQCLGLCGSVHSRHVHWLALIFLLDALDFGSPQCPSGVIGPSLVRDRNLCAKKSGAAIRLPDFARVGTGAGWRQCLADVSMYGFPHSYYISSEIHPSLTLRKLQINLCIFSCRKRTLSFLSNLLEHFGKPSFQVKSVHFLRFIQIAKYLQELLRLAAKWHS